MTRHRVFLAAVKHERLARDTHAPVHDDIGHARKHHVGLASNRLGNTFANHTVADDGHLGLAVHPLYLSTIQSMGL